MSFEGLGYARFTMFKPCDVGHFHLSLQLRTTQADGVLVHTGSGNLRHFNELSGYQLLLLELFNGTPRVIVDSGTTIAEIYSSGVSPLNDGEWHTIELHWDKTVSKKTLLPLIIVCDGTLILFSYLNTWFDRIKIRDD